MLTLIIGAGVFGVSHRPEPRSPGRIRPGSRAKLGKGLTLDWDRNGNVLLTA
jgi:hypothetical protein